MTIATPRQSHATLALRLNLILVLPVALAFTAFAGSFELGSFMRRLVISAIVTTSISISVSATYPLWRRIRLEPPALWVLLGTFVFPLLSLPGLLLAKGVLVLLPGSIAALPIAKTLIVAVPVAIFHGMSISLSEGYERRLDEAERNRLELETLRNGAELKALRSLIEPHFLLNTLNGISALIGRDPQAATKMVLQLASMFRGVLDERDLTFVPLKNEIKVAEAYMAIQSTRMGDRLRFEVDVPESMSAIETPAFILQPLVENAVIHGAEMSETPVVVSISARREGHTCMIDVTDDGPGPGGQGGLGAAMTLIRDRLRLLYDDQATLDLKRDSARGLTVVSLQFPEYLE